MTRFVTRSAFDLTFGWINQSWIGRASAELSLASCSADQPSFLFFSMSRRCRSLWRRRSRSASVCSNDLRRWMWKRKLCFGGPPSKIITVWWLQQQNAKSWCFFFTITLLFFHYTDNSCMRWLMLLWFDWKGNSRAMIGKGKSLKRSKFKRTNQRP